MPSCSTCHVTVASCLQKTLLDSLLFEPLVRAWRQVGNCIQVRVSLRDGNCVRLHEGKSVRLQEDKCALHVVGVAGSASPTSTAGQVLDGAAAPGARRISQELAGWQPEGQGGVHCPQGPAGPDEDCYHQTHPGHRCSSCPHRNCPSHCSFESCE